MSESSFPSDLREEQEDQTSLYAISPLAFIDRVSMPKITFLTQQSLEAYKKWNQKEMERLLDLSENTQRQQDSSYLHSEVESIYIDQLINQLRRELRILQRRYQIQSTISAETDESLV